ncbi:MAG: flagellar basal body protein FliL [Deltaproteobacteria bacterium]|nr:MAG: flagellar basal body protein FliL [Deltaproteobacteria bacterium]
MSNAATNADEEIVETPKKSGKKALILGVVLAFVGAGLGFFAIYTGLVFGHPESDTHAEGTSETEATTVEPLPAVAFVPLEPLTVSLAPTSDTRFLRFRGELEVVPGKEEEVARMQPRIMDVLNSYLRAVSIDELQRPAALIDIRAQMLRRIQIVVGEGRVRDLLIMEFVLN